LKATLSRPGTLADYERARKYATVVLSILILAFAVYFFASLICNSRHPPVCDPVETKAGSVTPASAPGR
jgi:hypothetical protein